MNIEQYDYKTLKALAKVGILTVNFAKVGGGDRKMVFTLVPEFLDTKPSFIRPIGRHKTVEDNASPMRVYDIEADGWRSFIPNHVWKVDWEPAKLEDFAKKYLVEKVYTFKVVFTSKEPINVDAVFNALKVWFPEPIRIGVSKA